MTCNWISFLDGCAVWDITVTEAQLSQLERYYEMLSEKNQQINLTAITDFTETLTLHFLDSLAMGAFYRDTLQGRVRVIDVGSGAGFPGLVLKILFPAWDITLLDAQKKRVEFLRDVADTLKLTHLTVIHGRAEELGKDPLHRECYDAACARAVTRLRVLTEYLLPFVKIRGFACAYKTPDDGAELAEAESAIQALGGGAVSCTDYSLPGTDVKRRLIQIEKAEETPSQYPRRAGIPEKRPL